MTHDQRRTVAIIGGTGRVGQALIQSLADSSTVRHIRRYELGTHDDFAEDVARQLADVDVTVNVAGVAHLGRHPSAGDMRRLIAANVLLPLALARACLWAGTPLIHVSSTKASVTGPEATAYAWSKRACDDVLSTTFDDAYREAGLSLAIVRPPALLFPPFDAGKLRRLRNLYRIPERLVPRISVPVLAPEQFIGWILTLIEDCTGSEGIRRSGVSVVDSDPGEWGDLRAIRAAMRDASRQQEGHGS